MALANVETIDLPEAFQRIKQSKGTVCVLGALDADNVVKTDHIPGPGETVVGGALHLYGGGKSGNQAASAAHIGAKTKLFGAVGDDSNADFLIDLLNKVGVDTSHVLRTKGPTGITMITVDKNGENTVVVSPGANEAVLPHYLETVVSELTVGTVLGLCLEVPLETVIASAKAAHNAGLKVLLNDSPFTPNIPQELIDASDILIANENEMSRLLGITDVVEGDWQGLDWVSIAEKMADFGFEQAVVTLGSHGAYVLDSGIATRIPVVPVKTVDTTGCGDAFMGSVLSGLAAGLSLVESAQLASYVAAYAARGEGAQSSYGNPEEILNLLWD